MILKEILPVVFRLDFFELDIHEIVPKKINLERR
jgi:hypothetical protein